VYPIETASVRVLADKRNQQFGDQRQSAERELLAIHLTERVRFGRFELNLRTGELAVNEPEVDGSPRVNEQGGINSGWGAILETSLMQITQYGGTFGRS
jgi:hypothetical protein